MISIFTPALRQGNFSPVVHAYYDRADMHSTTKEETNHAHTLCEIMYVCEGSIAVDVEGAYITVGRKQFIWLDSSVAHQLLLEDMPFCSVVNIEFQFEDLPAKTLTIGDMYRSDPAFKEMLDTPASYMVLTDTDDTIYNLLKQIVLLADSTHHESEALCSWLTSQLLLLMARRRQLSSQKGSKPIRNAYISSALEYIDEHFCEQISVQQVASMLHVQSTYLHRLFKEHMGLTIGEYITQLRIEQAKELLTCTNRTLLDIATSVGFSSQQRLTQLFRRLTALSPLEYRQQSQHKGGN